MILTYGKNLYGALTQPRDFFRKNIHSSQLTFGLMTHWLGAFLSYFNIVLGSLLWDQSPLAFTGYWNPFLGLGLMLLDPLITLSALLMQSFLLYLGARYFIPQTTSYSLFLNLLSISLAPSILTVIPAIGTFLAPLGTIVMTLLGLKTIFQIDWIRVFSLYCFPTLIIILSSLLFTGLILGLGILCFAFFI